MVDTQALNELYNLLDLYIVTSRIEGGPQAIIECGLSKTPIISTDVGVASEILSVNSIFDGVDFETARADIEYAYKNSLNFSRDKGLNEFYKMLKKLN